MVLLDADVMIDLMRGFPGAVAWMRSLTEPVGIPGYAMLELIAGCRSTADVQRVNRETAAMRVLWPSRPHCERALQDYKTLLLSHGVGAFDILIGHTAIELRLPLHTFNVKHYGAVPGLTTIQPYIR